MHNGNNFRIRNIKEIYYYLYAARKEYKGIKRIFLAYGDDLAVSSFN